MKVLSRVMSLYMIITGLTGLEGLRMLRKRRYEGRGSRVVSGFIRAGKGCMLYQVSSENVSRSHSQGEIMGLWLWGLYRALRL